MPSTLSTLNTFICMRLFSSRKRISAARDAIHFSLDKRLAGSLTCKWSHTYMYRCVERKKAGPTPRQCAFTYFSPLFLSDAFWLSLYYIYYRPRVSAALIFRYPRDLEGVLHSHGRFTADCVSVLRSQRKNVCRYVGYSCLPAQQSQSKQNVAASRTKAISKRHAIYQIRQVPHSRQSALSVAKEQKASSIRFEFYAPYCHIRIVP